MTPCVSFIFPFVFFSRVKIHKLNLNMECNKILGEKTFEAKTSCFLCGDSKKKLIQLQTVEVLKKCFEICSQNLQDEFCKNTYFHMLSCDLEDPVLLYHLVCYNKLMKKSDQILSSANKEFFVKIVELLQDHVDKFVNIRYVWENFDFNKKWTFNYLKKKLRHKFNQFLEIKGDHIRCLSEDGFCIKKLDGERSRISFQLKTMIISLAANLVKDVKGN